MTILEMTNAHLKSYKPRANIRNSKGVKYKEIISKLFPGSPRQSGVEAALRREWIIYSHVAESVYRSCCTVSIF